MLNDPTAKKKFTMTDEYKKKFLEDTKAEHEKIYGKDLQDYLGILISKYEQEGGFQNKIKALWLKFIKFISPFIDAMENALDAWEKAGDKFFGKVDEIWDKTAGKAFNRIKNAIKKKPAKTDRQVTLSPEKFDKKFANDKTSENLTTKIKNLRKKPANNYDKGSSFDFITKSVSNVNNVKNTVKKSPLEVFVDVQKRLSEYSQHENFSPELIKDPNVAIHKAEKSIKDIQKKIENVKQMQRSGIDTTLKIYEQELQKLSPQQRKEIDQFISPENRIKIWEQNIKFDKLIIEKANAKIKQAQVKR